jgi:hypothetical protein
VVNADQPNLSLHSMPSSTQSMNRFEVHRGIPNDNQQRDQSFIAMLYSTSIEFLQFGFEIDEIS